MPSEEKHKAQYEHNKKLLDADLLNPEKTAFGDWYITVAFYGAIHLIEKRLSQVSLHPKNHNDRFKCITRYEPLKVIATAYQTLYNQSRRARYACVSFTSKDLKDAQGCLKKIETELLR